MIDILSGLNEQQKEAVTHINGPLMIIAGAGSGKTKVLTTRIANLMAHGVDSFNILALTFTNKAAAEMKERIEKILGNKSAQAIIDKTKQDALNNASSLAVTKTKSYLETLFPTVLLFECVM